MWVVRNQIRSIKITKIMMRRNQPRTITRMGMLLLGLPYFKPAFVLELWPLCPRATSTLQTPSHKHRANGSWEDQVCRMRHAWLWPVRSELVPRCQGWRQGPPAPQSSGWSPGTPPGSGRGRRSRRGGPAQDRSGAPGGPAPAGSAARSPVLNVQGGHEHAMREVISRPKPRPQRSSHLHIRTKRTRHSSCPRAITRTDGAAPRPSERLAARGTAFRPKYQIWGGPHQIWGGPPQTERARMQRYTALRHPTYARASSGDQWPSLAIPTQSAPISGPHSQSRRNRRQSVAFTLNPDAISGALDAPVLN